MPHFECGAFNHSATSPYCCSFCSINQCHLLRFAGQFSSKRACLPPQRTPRQRDRRASASIRSWIGLTFANWIAMPASPESLPRNEYRTKLASSSGFVPHSNIATTSQTKPSFLRQLGDPKNVRRTEWHTGPSWPSMRLPQGRVRLGRDAVQPISDGGTSWRTAARARAPAPWRRDLVPKNERAGPERALTLYVAPCRFAPRRVTIANRTGTITS